MTVSYPMAALEKIVLNEGITVSLDVRQCYYRARAAGQASTLIADKLAVKLAGRHPSLIWDTWIDDAALEPVCGICGEIVTLQPRIENPLCRMCYKAQSRKKPIGERARANRIAFHANLDDPRHGTGNGYLNLGCRCPRCSDAMKGHWAKWRKAGTAA